MDQDLLPVLQRVELGKSVLTPQVIHSDKGRNFESAVFAVMFENLGIQKTTPLHPQSNGLVERFIRTLAKQLTIVTAEDQCDWDTHLLLILIAYRYAVQDSMLCTPALLMLGLELWIPAELVLKKTLTRPSPGA